MVRAAVIFAAVILLCSDVTSLAFNENPAESAHNDIQFEAGNHGDGSSVDGPGGKLAQVEFLQFDGDVHFDDEEAWTINKRSGEQARNDQAPDLCKDARIDAITRTANGNTYVFKGGFYWKLRPNGQGIAESYPRQISDEWSGLDAAVTLSNGKTYFFKGRQYWSFTNSNMDSGFPKLISEGFRGIPDNLDAAVVWSGNGKLYFFKGDKYWLYDMNQNPPVPNFYPLSMSEWSRQLSDGVDAAIQWGSRTYFFKGAQYYRYNDKDSEIDTNPRYPLSTAREWFGCQ